MTKLGISITFVAVIVLVFGGFFIYQFTKIVPGMITSFEECAKGYPVMESYPRQCRTKDGKLFMEDVGTDSVPISVSGCYVGGCSGEVCSDQKDVVSNCIYKSEFACYKNSTCERQANGQCGWRQNIQLSSCIKNSSHEVATGYVMGHVTIGPNCPVERVDQPCPTPPEAYTSREAVVYGADGSTVKYRVHLDTQGNYKIALGQGNYFIQIVPAGIGPGEKKPATVKAGETLIVNFDIDTGIR